MYVQAEPITWQMVECVYDEGELTSKRDIRVWIELHTYFTIINSWSVIDSWFSCISCIMGVGKSSFSRAWVNSEQN